MSRASDEGKCGKRLEMEPSKMAPPQSRWLIMLSSFVVMMTISIYQYSWFLFAFEIRAQRGWDLATTGITFTCFAYAATFVQPLSGIIADSYGPRKVSIVSAVLTGLGFIFASSAGSPISLYLSYSIGGLGVGVLYGISTACAVKWFPDKRGLATGFVVFGFGAGTAIFNLLIEVLLKVKGISGTFLYLGIGMCILLIPLSVIYRYPSEHWESRIRSTGALAIPNLDYQPFEMMRTYQWFLIYFSFIATVSIVLLFGAQMKVLANEFNLPDRYFSVLLVLFPLGNGLSRVFAGAVSDRIGREKTMMVFYSILGVSIFCFLIFGRIAILFVIIVFIAALLGGSPFSLYPATIGDYYGARYSTTNYGITYTAKAWAGLIAGWLSGYLVMRFASYKIPLIAIAVGSLAAALVSHPKIMKAPSKGKAEM